MSVILGVDPAQKTGLGVFETSRSLSAIQASVLKSEGDSFEEKAGSIARQFLMQIRSLEKQGLHVALVALEAPLRQKAPARRAPKFMGQEQPAETVADGGGLNAIISSNQITGALMGIIYMKALPFVILHPQTWRKSFLGADVMRQAKAEKWDRPRWKRAVRDACARERIVVTNDDQADGVGIAVAARNTPEFKQIQYEQARRAA